MKGKIILGSLIVLFIILFVPNVSAKDTICMDCHPKYSEAMNARSNHDSICTICHKGGYSTTHIDLEQYIGYNVNESTCNQASCHSPTSGAAQRPINESHGNHYYGQNKADCTQCHFANTTRLFPLNSTNSLYEHDHNFTVEYNFYNYNISGIPLSTNNGVGKGMFPYYTCTLTCHGTYKVEDEVIGWEESAHARSNRNSGDNNSYCAKCKSPTNYNLSAASANKTDYNITDTNWQGIQCRICHNLHNDTYSGNGTSPVYFAFYNTTATLQTGSVIYDKTVNTTVLCEKCHSSSNDRKFAGTHKDTVGFDCADCHANSTFNNMTHKFEVKNTTSSVTGCEVCHKAEDHTFKFTSLHENDNVTCEACHDKTVARNSSGYVVNVSAGFAAGIYKDPSTNEWTTYKLYYGSPVTWSLHNISLSVDCNKCHGALSVFNGTIAPTFGNSTGCDTCHPSYVPAVNSTLHNQTLTIGAPGCTYCHSGYQLVANHTTGNRSFIVNESNKCRNCHVEGLNLNESHGNHGYGQNYADCTKCHFANTTQVFNATASTFTHDHNLTVEYNFYNYNISGIPLSTNGGVGKGMFPYYTCTLTCHNGTAGGQPKIENETIAWNQSGHAQVTSEADRYNMTCLRCHSPPMFNGSNTATIAESAKQGIQCRVCHNLHNDTYSGNETPINSLAFYNATLSNSTGSPVYDTVANATELCEKCHKGGYHTTSRDIYYNGSHKTSLGFVCVDCHMNSTINNGSTHTFEVSNGTSGLTGCESCHVADTVHQANFSQYWVHKNIVTCQACHDASFVLNSTNYVKSATIVTGGIYKNTNTNKWTTYRASSSTRSPTEWDFHNITIDVTCERCHGGYSDRNGSIAPALSGETGCVQCHPSYVNAVNSTMHNQTRNSAAPNCTQCHAGYETQHTGTIVNETNSCRNCHNATSGISPVNESHGNHNYGQNHSNCTQCHFANTTQQFSLNTSLFTHDHNLTVEYNSYNYNLYGLPTESNHSASKKGMFPYYTCTLTCHNGSVGGQPKIENETMNWSQSGHGQLSGSASYNSTFRLVASTTYPGLNGTGCITCKSPTQFNGSLTTRVTLQDWQGIQCRICHNLHNDTYSGNGTPINNIAYYNGTKSNLSGSPVYDIVANATELCEKCHTGYHNAIAYSGFHKTSIGFTCADCHMNSTVNNGSTHTFEVHNKSTVKTGCEACHATSVHTDSNFIDYSFHGNVTCEACHDNTVARNSSNYVVNISSFKSAGIYKDPVTNKWSTYIGSSSATTRSLHNISKAIDCNKCHGARSVISGAIAKNRTSGGLSYFSTYALISGYKQILIYNFIPETTIYANYLVTSSLSGVPGVNKTVNFNETSEKWEGYENANGVYLGTNFTVAGDKSYLVKGNSSSVGKMYTLFGRYN